MDMVQLNAAVYTPQRQLSAMEPWANGVNAALQDHAGHIDHRATASEAQRVHLVKSKEEHDQLKADLVKVVNDVATNDVGMQCAFEGAFADLSGMVKDLKVHCGDAVDKSDSRSSVS